MAIASVLLHKPGPIMADKPTTALDVTLQGQTLLKMRRRAVPP